MATAHMPDEFFDAVAHHLPPEQPVGPKGGRPRVGHRTALRVIWFVLTAGTRWEDVPRSWAAPAGPPIAGSGPGRRPGSGTASTPTCSGLLKRAGKLDLDTVIIDGVTVRAFGGGEATGPSPVDRGRPGTKHTVMVNKAGVPLVIRTAGANASDHTQFLPVILDFPRSAASRAGPRSCPTTPTPTGATTARRPEGLLRWLGIEPHIAKRRTPHGSGLGKVRWVVERTISWLKGLRRLRVRYDRLGVIMDAWTTLAASVICFRILHHDVI